MSGGKITSVEQIVRIGVENQFWLFRGHANHEWLLVPQVFRQECQGLMAVEKAEGGFEAIIATEFAVAAPSVYRDGPLPQDNIEWLSLMRHFRAPTRLLDWSRSVLVAAYFATEAEEGKDGELIAIDPEMLTNRVRDEYCHKVDPKYPSVIDAARVLALQARTDKRFWDHERCGHQNCCPYAIPFGPPLRFARVTNQLGWFTIHPHPEHQSRQSLEDFLTRGGLRRWTIASRLKPRLRDHLAALGITSRVLFPDLEGLAKSLVPEFRRKWQPEQDQQERSSE